MSLIDQIAVVRDGEEHPNDEGADWLLSSAALRLSAVNDAEWARVVKVAKPRRLQTRDWYVECTKHGNELLKATLEVSAKRMGGVPVLKGTRFTASQALAEIADMGSVQEVAEEFDLDVDALRRLLNGLALVLDRPFPE